MLLEKLLNTIAPVNCVRCGAEGNILCSTCLPAAFDIVPSRCFLCKQVTLDSEVCRRCRRNTPLRHVWIGTIYAGTAKQVVHHLKFAPDRTAAPLLARWLDETLSYINADVVTYVPTARARVRQRGFDQSKIMAKNFAHHRRLPFNTLLVRHGSSRQVGAEKKARQEQIKGAYSAKKQLNGEHVLLIDDITTTGATLREAARTLKQNGARSVSAVVFAQSI